MQLKIPTKRASRSLQPQFAMYCDIDQLGEFLG